MGQVSRPTPIRPTSTTAQSIGRRGACAAPADCHRVHAMAIIDGDQVSERVTGKAAASRLRLPFGTHVPEVRRLMCLRN